MGGAPRALRVPGGHLRAVCKATYGDVEDLEIGIGNWICHG